MNSKNSRRCGLLLTLAAVAAALGAAARDASAGDRPAQPGTRVDGRSESGYPRSDEGPAPVYEQSDDAGEKQGKDGMNYDSNLVLWDGFTDDVIVYDVMLACIDGIGHESDDDGSADTLKLAAWGADKVTFSAPGEAATTEMHVHNPIDIYASWHLRGNGRNFVDLHAVAWDICGARHDLVVTATTSAQAAGEDGTSWSTSIRGKSSKQTSVAVGSELSVSGDADGSVEVSAEGVSYANARWTAGADVQGTAAFAAFAMYSTPGNSVTVEVQSEESAVISAQALTDGQCTTADFPNLDTDNVVKGSYVTLTGGGPGTPGGDNSTGPGTPGGDGGGSPTTGTGTSPESPGGSGGGEGGGTAPAEPEAPREPAEEMPLPPPEEPLPDTGISLAI